MGRILIDKGIDWVGLVPEEWTFQKGKYLFRQRNDRGNKNELQLLSPTQKFGCIPQSLYEELTGANTVKLNDKADLNSLKTIHKGDFCISLRSFQGGFEYSNYEGVVSPAYQVFYPIRDDVYRGYYKYMFKDGAFIDKMNSFTLSLRDGKNIAFDDFGNTLLPVPSVEEQQAIADYLDKKTAEIDKAIKDAQELIDSYKTYKQSIIYEAVTKGLNPNVTMKDSDVDWVGAVPENWKFQRGKYLFRQRNNRGNKIELQLLSPTQKFGCIPQSLYEELTGANTVKVNDKTDLNLLKTIHEGDFCISLRSFQGGFEYSNYEGVVSPAYQVFYPIRDDVYRGYYKYMFKDGAFIDKMNSFTLSLRDGKNIAFDDFGNTLLPVPPVEEQQAISDYLDNKCGQIDGIISQKENLITQLQEYKKSIIFEYVTGKKEVPNG